MILWSKNPHMETSNNGKVVNVTTSALHKEKIAESVAAAEQIDSSTD